MNGPNWGIILNALEWFFYGVVVLVVVCFVTGVAWTAINFVRGFVKK